MGKYFRRPYTESETRAWSSNMSRIWYTGNRLHRWTEHEKGFLRLYNLPPPNASVLSTISLTVCHLTSTSILSETKCHSLIRQPSFLSSSDCHKVPMLNQSLPLYNFYPLVLDLSSGAPKNFYSFSHMMILHILEDSSSLLLSQTKWGRHSFLATHI